MEDEAFNVKTSFSICPNVTNFQTETDTFEGVFSNKYLNWCMYVLYVLGLISCLLLIIVSWFEKSGQAGPFRTLANQLVSHKLDQMVLLYTVGFGPYASRAIFGPLPGVLCKIGTFGMQFFGMNICLIAIAIGWSKLGFAYIYKTIPVMDDKFFATYIVANIHLVTLLAIGAKSVVDEKHMLSHERICSGTWSDKDLELKNFPVAALVAVGSWMACTVSSIALKCKRNRPVAQEVQKHPNNTETKLDNVMLVYLSSASTGLLGALFLAIVKLGDPEIINGFPQALVYHAFSAAIPNVMVTTHAVLHFCGNKHIMRAAKRIVSPDQIIPVME